MNIEKKSLKKLSLLTNDYIILLCTVFSIFLPYIITGLMLVFVTVYIFTRVERIKSVFAVKHLWALLTFFALVLIVPAIYKRWVSLLAGILCILILIFLLYVRSVMTKQLFSWVVDLCCVMSIVIFVIALIQKLISEEDGYRSMATFFNPNYFGTIAEFVLIMCVFKLLTVKKYIWFYGITVVINMLSILLSGSQSAIPAVVGAIMLLLVMTKNYKIALTFIMLAVAAVILSFVMDIFPRLDLMDQSSVVRMQIWNAAVQGIKQHPLFGQGVLTYFFVYEPLNGFPTQHAHNLLLDPLLSFGFIGTGLMALFFFSIYKKVVIDFVNTKNNKTQILILAITSAIVIHGVTDLTLLWLQTGMLFVVVLGASNVDANCSKEIVV